MNLPGHLCIPVIDRSRPDVVERMEALGITTFLPITNLINASFGSSNQSMVPLLSAESAIRLVNQLADNGSNSRASFISFGSPWPKDPQHPI